MNRWRIILGLLVCCWIAVPPRAQAIDPLGATAPLGTTATATLTVQNPAAQPATVQLYEAWPAAPRPGGPANRPWKVPLPAIEQRIDPQLRADLANAPDGRSLMIVYLADQADLGAAAATPGWVARGAAVYAALHDHAAASQAPLLRQLAAKGVKAQSYWIVNALAVSGDSGLAAWLAEQPAVALVGANRQHQLDTTAPIATGTPLDGLAWGVDQINAPEVWDNWGVRGEGIVVANIDTGVYVTHTALLQNYRGWSASGLNHNYNWFDPTDAGRTVPVDPNGHGTHTMGTMAARSANGSTVGVAPAVRWIAARGCASTLCYDDDLIASAQWILAPTRLGCTPDLAEDCDPRPDLRPQILNNSWGEAGNRQWYVGYVEAWNASGIASFFANGNYGRLGCRTAITPATYPNAFGVGATDPNDYIADFSSRGPTDDGRTKPDMSAPGTAIPSTWPNGGYELMQGTSMATPHVAGAAALLWSVNPSLIGDLPATYELLTRTSAALYSTECGDPPDGRPNNVYGWGRLDIAAAVRAARVDVPWLSLAASVSVPAHGSSAVTVTFDGRQVIGPGTYSARILMMRNGSTESVPVEFTVTAAPDTALVHGRLVDRWSGEGVYGRVRFAGGPLAQTDLSGAYTLTLPYGRYDQLATASNYLSATASIAVPVQTTSAITLTPDQPHVVAALPVMSATLDFGQRSSTPITLTNLGPRPLTVNATVPPYEWSVAESPINGPNEPLYAMQSFPALALADDQVYTDTFDIGFSIPIYGAINHEIAISSNGWVSFVKRENSASSASCLPASLLPKATLAPFWTDLDPSQGGAIRAGRVQGGTFVVSYEAVPRWQSPQITMTLAPTYTFQVALHMDGAIEYRYGAMGAMPERWSVGAAYDLTRGQSIACFNSVKPLAGRSFLLRNQASTRFWISAAPLAITVQPGETATMDGLLIGLGYTPWRDAPAEGVLRLETNDPRQRKLDVPAFVVVGPPPHLNNWPLFIR